MTQSFHWHYFHCQSIKRLIHPEWKRNYLDNFDTQLQSDIKNKHCPLKSLLYITFKSSFFYILCMLVLCSSAVCLYEKVRFPGTCTRVLWKSSHHSQSLSHFSSPDLYKIYFIFIETWSHDVVMDIFRWLCNPGCFWIQISPCYYLLSAYIKECDTLTNPQSATLDIISYINYFIYIRTIFMHKAYCNGIYEMWFITEATH